MTPSNTTDQKKSFIEQARRAQIVAATIHVLAKYGYLNTSFARIAKQAGIAPSLISYHFKDKAELTAEVFAKIVGERVQHVYENTAAADSATKKLRVAIESDIKNMASKSEQYQACTEILFSMRSDQGSLVYTSDQDGPMLTLLNSLLLEGQKSGEFGKFDTYSVALIIEGAKDSFLAQLPMRKSFNAEVFTDTLIKTTLHFITKKQKTF